MRGVPEGLELIGAGGRHDNVAAQRGVDALADAAAVREAHHEAVLPVVELVLVLKDISL